MSSIRKTILLDYDKYLRWKSIIQRSQINTSNQTGGKISIPNSSNIISTDQFISNGTSTNERIVDEGNLNSTNQIITDSGEDKGEQGNKLSDDIILQSIPIKLRNKTKQILFQLNLLSPIITWDKTGQIICSSDGKQQEIIYNSNIIDIIRDSLLHRGYRQFIPIGCDQFYSALSHTNYPLSLISNTYRRDQVTKERTQVGSGNFNELLSQESRLNLLDTKPPGILVNAKSAFRKLKFRAKKSIKTGRGLSRSEKWIKIK